MYKKISFVLGAMMMLMCFIVPTAFGASSVPTGVSVVAGSEVLNVSWSTASGAESYNVYAGATKKNVSPITGTSYQITGLTNGTSYSITVTSVDEADVESAKSTAVVRSPSVTSSASGFVALAGSFIALIESAILIFMEPPIVWYVALAFLVAGIAITKGLIPRKKAK